MNTNELLRRYVESRSEAAFDELVAQHLDLVYSAALRQVNGDVPRRRMSPNRSSPTSRAKPRD